MGDLNLDQLQTFSEVLQLGSFSAAARRLNLTQPAVSLKIKQLESRLGVRLVERVGKRAHPTAAGLDLLKHFQKIKEAVDNAESAMAYHREGGIAKVRLGTGATACIYLLPAVLRDLRTRFPFLEVTVRTGNASDILNSLQENTLDVGLVTLPAPGKMFEVVSVFDDELIAIFPRDRMQIPEEATASALFELPLLLYESGGHTRSVIDDWFVRGGVSAKPIMELGSIEAIKKLVSAGLGCAILPYPAVADNQPGDELLVRFLSPPLHRKLGVVLRRDKPLGPGLREVVEALMKIRSRVPEGRHFPG